MHNYRSPNYLPENLENSRLCGMALGQNQPHVQKPQIIQFILNKARIWIHAGTLLTAGQRNGHYRRRGASTSAVRTRQKKYNSNRTSVYKYGSVHCNNSLKNWGNNRSI